MKALCAFVCSVLYTLERFFKVFSQYILVENAARMARYDTKRNETISKPINLIMEIECSRTRKCLVVDDMMI